MADFKSFLKDNSDALVSLGAGLMRGTSVSEQLGNGLAGFATARNEAQSKNKTLDFLRERDPEIAALMENGALDGSTAAKLWYEKKLQSEKPRGLMNVNGALVDEQTGQLVADYRQPKAQPTDEYEIRKAAAAQLGLAPEDPRYQSFVLTGKMPREDAQPLSPTDKKAIFEADEQVLSNQNAIDSLNSANSMNNDAYSGFTAGVRTWAGNNLPDYLVPDKFASPEKAAATAEFDNQIMNSAMGQLKTIFGGNPTEGERAILLELQASSSKPPQVRKQILDRAVALARKRLEFNKQRADELRGGTFYQPQGGGVPGAAPVGTTSSGASWRVK